MKTIRDKTGVKIDIPRKDGLTPGLSNLSNGHSNAPNPSISGTATPLIVEEDEQEPTIQIMITGPQPLAEEAQALVNDIIAYRTATTTQRIRDIPANILPFILPQRAAFEAAAQGGDINTSFNAAVREITVSGDREAVIRVVEAIKGAVESFMTGLTSVSLTLPKRQHRLLTGKATDEIMAESKCVVVIPQPEDPSSEVVVWGQSANLPAGLSAVMTKSNSAYIHEFPLPGPIATSKNILAYMGQIDFVKTLTTAYPTLAVYTPAPSTWASSTSLNIELVGDKSIVDDAIKKISELIGKLIGALKDVPADWLVHRIILHKNAKK